jgi:hypothetical protein
MVFCFFDFLVAASLERSAPHDNSRFGLLPGRNGVRLPPTAPVTNTVRTADELSAERQRGRVLGNPGMTAEAGSNPALGAVLISGDSMHRQR